MVNLLVLVVLVAILALAIRLAAAWSVRHRALQRLQDDAADTRAAAGTEPPVPERRLARWLSLAGFRRPSAPALFIVATVAAASAGLVAGQVYRATLAGPLLDMVSSVPGGVGDLVTAVLQGGPWI